MGYFILSCICLSASQKIIFLNLLEKLTSNQFNGRTAYERGKVLGFVLSNGNQLPLSVCLVFLSDHFPIFSSANSDSTIINLECNIFFSTSMKLILIITSPILLDFYGISRIVLL